MKRNHHYKLIPEAWLYLGDENVPQGWVLMMTFVDGHSATNANWSSWVCSIRKPGPFLNMPPVIGGSLFLHDIDVHCSEEVLQGLHGRGQPMVCRGDVPLYDTFSNFRLRREEKREIQREKYLYKKKYGSLRLDTRLECWCSKVSCNMAI